MQRIWVDIREMCSGRIEQNASVRTEQFPCGVEFIALTPADVAAKDAEIAKLKTEIAALTKRTATYEAGIRAVVVLIDESHGVDGLHKNGDIATWSELRAGGNFESWLSAFDAAVEVLGNG